MGRTGARQPVIRRRPSRWLRDIAAAGQRACSTPPQPSTKPTRCYRLCPPVPFGPPIVVALTPRGLAGVRVPREHDDLRVLGPAVGSPWARSVVSKVRRSIPPPTRHLGAVAAVLSIGMDVALHACGLRGHATFAPDEPELQARLRVETPAGDAWRCLRCETFVVGEPAGHGPAETAPHVRRGRNLRDVVIMRALAVERVVRAVIFTLLAVGVLAVRGTHGRLQTAFENELPLIRPLGNQIGWNPDNSKLLHHIDQAFSLSPTTLAWIAVGLFAYAAVELIEAIGLWLITRWGEYFAVIATSVFLPLEIYEITEKVTAFRAIALAINIAAVLWLLWTKRLFGLNGGAAAYHAEHNAATLLAVEQAAAA